MLTRLQRIELLERERAHPSLVLAELRELLREAKPWLDAEGAPGEAARALEQLGAELAP